MDKLLKDRNYKIQICFLVFKSLLRPTVFCFFFFLYKGIYLRTYRYRKITEMLTNVNVQVLLYSSLRLTI